MKGELTQTKQQLEKLYSSSEKIDEKMFVQRPTYDKNRLGYLLSQSTKKPNEIKEPNPKPLEANRDLNKIESSKSIDAPNIDEHVNHSRCTKEPKQVVSPKEVRHEF